MSYHFTKEQINIAYNALPDDVRDFYSKEKTAVNIYNIGKKYNLHVDAVGKLGELVGLAIMGLVPLIDFNKELVERTGVAEDTANLIIYDLNQEVFGPIRESMLAMVKQKVQAQTASQNPRPVATQNPVASTPVIPPTANAKQPYSPSSVFGIAKEEVDVKAKASDNIVTEPNKKPLDPYHEQV